MYNYIKINFPDYDKQLQPRLIMKIDMIRYFLMYKEGGIYADLDYKFIKNIDEIIILFYLYLVKMKI